MITKLYFYKNEKDILRNEPIECFDNYESDFLPNVGDMVRINTDKKEDEYTENYLKVKYRNFHYYTLEKKRFSEVSIVLEDTLSKENIKDRLNT